MAYSAGRALHPGEWVDAGTLLASVDIRFSAVPAGLNHLLSNSQAPNALGYLQSPLTGLETDTVRVPSLSL